MRINAVNSVCFKGKIIDAHMHVGNWGNKQYSTEQLDTFIKSPLPNGDVIDKAIVSNLSAIDSANMLDETKGNLEMLEVAKNNPKIVSLAVCQPKTGSVENIKKLFQENPHRFVGLKFHPDGHQIMASDDLFNPYLKFAEKEKLPCLFHCGINWEGDKFVKPEFQYSSPDAVYQAAKRIPKTPVILAHLGAGGEKVHQKAINVLMESIDKNDANLYADISWVDVDNPDKPNIVKLIKNLKEKNKLDRIMFGSDAPIGEFDTGKNGLSGTEFYNKTIVDIKSAIKKNFQDDADSIIDKIFYKNANDLFFKDKPIKQQTNKSYSKWGIAIAVGLVIIGAILWCKSKNTTQNDDKIKN